MITRRLGAISDWSAAFAYAQRLNTLTDSVSSVVVCSAAEFAKGGSIHAQATERIDEKWMAQMAGIYPNTREIVAFQAIENQKDLRLLLFVCLSADEVIREPEQPPVKMGIAVVLKAEAMGRDSFFRYVASFDLSPFPTCTYASQLSGQVFSLDNVQPPEALDLVAALMMYLHERYKCDYTFRIVFSDPCLGLACAPLWPPVTK